MVVAAAIDTAAVGRVLGLCVELVAIGVVLVAGASAAIVCCRAPATDESAEVRDRDCDDGDACLGGGPDEDRGAVN